MTKTTQAEQAPAEQAPQTISLAAALSKKSVFNYITFWIVGDTPLITHAWSEKARREMLFKQVKGTKPGKEARDPQEDFVNSLYQMGDDAYGFPVTGIKNCILSAAHKDKGIPRTDVRAALYLSAEMVRVRPALAGAMCDVPLVRIWGSKPEMREDMVRIGSGLNKTANLSYRGQFTTWAIRVVGKFNATTITAEQLAFVVQEAGMSYGLGEWRVEKDGIFGSFHLAVADEEAAWEKFAAGKGRMPVPESYKAAAE